MDMQLKNKVALITGGSRGIGREIGGGVEGGGGMGAVAAPADGDDDMGQGADPARGEIEIDLA